MTPNSPNGSLGDAQRSVLVGAGFGTAITFATWLGEMMWASEPSFAAIVAAHRAGFAPWVVDLAPVGLGLLGAVFSRTFGESPTERSGAPSAGAPQPAAAPAEVDPTGGLGRALFQMSMDGIVVLTAEGRVVAANAASGRIFGWSPEEMAGRDVAEFLPKHGDQEATLTTVRRTGHDTVLGIEMQLDGRHRSGDLFPLEMTDTATEVDGRRVHVYQLRDISERRSHEERTRKVNQVLQELRDQALEASRAKSAFLANMSHELRTPMNAILGYSEMLREEAQDRDLHDLVPDLDKINGAGRHLLALINSILDLSKIEAGKMELHMEAVEVSRVVAELEQLARPLAAKNRNELVVRMEGDPGRMVTDLTKLRQVLLNVVGNANKFCEGGTVTITVDRYRPVDADWISFRVTDTGIGMDAEQLGRLFQDFQQADASTTRRFGGTGLGLAISKRFCQMLGGEIVARSTPGEGATFVIRLPANTASDGDVPLPIADASAARVLVVDDDPGVRDLLARTLAREGFVVATASTGEQALVRAREFAPHVMTLDVRMPDMDGWAVLSSLKNDPATAHVPVVMVSMIEEQRAGYALGAAGWLTKPIDRRRLVATLDGLRGESTPYHVLLVEDEPDVREVVRRTLEQDGWTVAEARDGREALDSVAARRPTVILLDLMMPEMDGFQFLTELDRVEAWREIPVVVVTAMDLDPAQRQRLEARVDRILQKGAYRREELVDMVRAKVRRHALASAEAMLRTEREESPT